MTCLVPRTTEAIGIWIIALENLNDCRLVFVGGNGGNGSVRRRCESGERKCLHDAHLVLSIENCPMILMMDQWVEKNDSGGMLFQ